MKPENLLLSDPSDSAILKIADFGLSNVIFAAESREPAEVDTITARSQYNGQLSPGSRVSKVDVLKDQRNSVFRFQHAQSSYSTPPKTTHDVSPAAFRRLKSVVGSPHYIAPEIAMDGEFELFLFHIF